MCRNDELSSTNWLFTNRFSATVYMKVKRMGITEILRRIRLFSANKTKSLESFNKQPTQLIVDLTTSLQHIIATNVFCLVLLQTQNVMDASKLVRTDPKCVDPDQKQLFTTEFYILNHVQNVWFCPKQFVSVQNNLDAFKIVLDL